MAQENIFLKAALQYIRIGIPAFPVKERGKEPLTAHGCRDASTDENQIKKWWQQYPNANVGLAMGNGLIAIDLDVDEDKGVNGYHVLCDWQRENGELPDTILSITGRGGYHMIFRTEKDYKNAVGLYDGVDVRSNGGYIIAPPSIHPNGHTYQWEQAPDEYEIAQADNLVDRFLQGERQETQERFSSPEVIPEGQRNAVLYRMACSMRAKGYSENTIFAAVKAENAEKCNPSLSDKEVDTIVKSALRHESGTGIEPKNGEERKPGKLDAFHLFNDKGRITGVFDFAIFEHLKKQQDIFVLGGTPYLYEGGVFIADETGAKLKTMIRELIYPTFIKSTTVKRIYELFLADAELEVSFEDINKYPPHWINFKNGFFDPKTGRMVEHSPKYRATNQLPHRYDPTAHPEGEKVEEWLQFVFDNADDREMNLQYHGLTMTRDVSQQKFLVYVGEAGSGKSTLIRMNEEMIGSQNVSNISLTELQQRFASYGLMGKLLNSCADLEIAALEDTSTLKKCLGEDTLRGERKGYDAISFRSYAKLIFSTNELPLVKAEKTNGFYRRLLVLPINKVPEKKNADLFTELSAQIDYYIKLSVEALQRMYASGTITESAASVAAVSQLRCDSDTVQAFLEEETSRKAGERIERGALFAKYENYCQDMDRMSLSRTNFYKSLRSKGYKEIRLANGRYFSDISFEKSITNLSGEVSQDGFITIPDNLQEELPFD